MQLYNQIIKYLSVWFIASLILILGLVGTGGYLHGELSQMKIRLREKIEITDKLYVHIDSVNTHYLDMERNGCFVSRIKNDTL